jgi:iron(III) transport system ATP-binding protein
MSQDAAPAGQRRRHFAVEGLTKVFSTEEGAIRAVDDVSFSIEGDTFFTMLGPSGCGKTTTLRMIAGLETISEGRIVSDGADFTKMNAFERNIGMVFQSYALFPHMTVFENAAYGLRLRRAQQSRVDSSVKRILAMLQLDGLAHRYPADLSGGQQQRVSIARALVYEPGMLLLDEPLANLDAKLRVEMRDEIRRLQKALGVMALYVTHDQEEAMAVSDSIAVFSKGRLMQVGAPYEIYAVPASLFVADFIGKANFFPMRADTSGSATKSGTVFKGMARRRAGNNEADWFAKDCEAMLMVRPERMWLEPAAKVDASATSLAGTVRRIQFLGTFVRYLVEADDATRPVLIDRPAFVEGVSEGEAVRFGFSIDDAVLFEKPAP